MKRGLLLPLLAITLLYGCAKAPVEFDHYQPVIKNAGDKLEAQWGLSAIKNGNAAYTVTGLLVGAENVVVVYLKIENRTGSDLLPSDYSVGLTDGRDRLPLQLISREAVIAYRAREAGGDKVSSGNGMVDLALTQLGNLTRTMGNSQLVQFLASLDWAVDHYFAFRPVYAGQSREGLLCYSVNFVREYPLTLEVRIGDRTYDFDFLPVKK
jgi:hypothetical protein